MKKSLLVVVLVLFTLLITVTSAGAKKPVTPDGDKAGVQDHLNACTTIQDGALFSSAGDLLTTGFDAWGYNYQAHLFKGGYCDAYQDAAWCQEYKDVDLTMKWNDAWLSNQDCDGDGKLDRHDGFASYIGSGAWETNHQKGSYEDENGNTCNWEAFTKIVAASAGATLSDGVWYNADGTEIGTAIWGEFAIIEDVTNDPCGGAHGVNTLSPDHAGFGGW